MRGTSVSPWLPVIVLGAALLSIFLVLGYGLIGFAILFLLLAMAGGAFLYWKDGE